LVRAAARKLFAGLNAHRAHKGPSTPRSKDTYHSR
jgi:hypothetical protein